MSKTKTIAIPADVQRAEQAFLQSRKIKLELLAALEAAKGEEERLESALRQARITADSAGPCGTIDLGAQAIFGRRGERVVIVKRTASSVWTRPVGTSADSELQQWRKSKTHGDWYQYPSPYYGGCRLTIDGEQA